MKIGLTAAHFLPKKKNTQIPRHNFVFHSVKLTFLASGSSCSGALLWKKTPKFHLEVAFFYLFFFSFLRVFKYEDKSEGLSLNVVGQTGKDCLLTLADSVKVADRRKRTHKCQPYFKLPPLVFQKWHQKFCNKVAVQNFCEEQNKKTRERIRSKIHWLNLTGFWKSPYLGVQERELESCGASSPTPRITQPVRSKSTSSTSSPVKVEQCWSQAGTHACFLLVCFSVRLVGYTIVVSTVRARNQKSFQVSGVFDGYNGKRLLFRDSRTIRPPRFKSLVAHRYSSFSFWTSLSKDKRQAPSVGSLQKLISRHLLK